MAEDTGRQERHVLYAFLASEWREALLGFSLTDVVVEQHPMGKSSPPDFCLRSGEHRVAAEVLRAMQEDSQRTSRKHEVAQSKDLPRVEQEVRKALPDCEGWCVHIASFPPRKQHKEFVASLVEELGQLCAGRDVAEDPRQYPKSLLLREHGVVFMREARNRRLHLVYNFSTGVDYGPVVDNVLRHLQTFDAVARKFSDLILLVHDCEGLIGTDLKEFAFLLDRRLGECATACPSSFDRLRGILVVHESPFWSTVPLPPLVELAWPVSGL